MIRKIIKVGNSEGVTIPTSTLRAYKLKVGDQVEIYLGPEIEQIQKKFTPAKKRSKQ